MSMSPTELRNSRLAERMIKNLARRNMQAFYCPTAQEAVSKVLELIPAGSSVTWGGSMTIRDIGIPDALRAKGCYDVLDRDLVEGDEAKVQMYVRAFTTDVYLSSANAISEDGVIVNIDGNGNRVAAITWGPKKVIFIIGINKVAQTVEAALARARSTAPVSTSRHPVRPMVSATTATPPRASATTSTSSATPPEASTPSSSSVNPSATKPIYTQ